MWRGYDAADTPALHALHKVGGGCCVGGAVVDARYNMAMDIGGETKTGGFFMFAAEEIEHYDIKFL